MLSQVSILSICFLYNVSYIITKPFVSLLAQSLNASSTTIGLLVSVQFLFPMLLSIPAGQTVDFFGARRVLILGSLLITSSGVIYLCANNVWGLYAAQIISGIGLLVVWLASQTVATQVHSGVGDRDSFVGYFGSFSAAGQLLAPILGGAIADAWGYRMALGSTIVSGVTILLFTLSLPKHEARQGRINHVLFNSYADAWSILIKNHGVQLVALSSFVPLFVNLIRVSFLPLYLHDLNFSNTMMGVILSLGPLVAVFCRATMRPMIRILSRRFVLFGTIITASVAMALFPLFKSFWPLAILSAACGWGSGMNEPMAITLVAAYSQGRNRGIALGLRLAINRLTMFLAPLLFAGFMKTSGLSNAFLLSGSVLLAWTIGPMAYSYKLKLGPDLGVRDGSVQPAPDARK
jgi:MFS family permease